MKYTILFVFNILMLTSCNTKSAKEKLKIENSNQAIAMNLVVGIGKIIPEHDIIQLSSPVNGIVQKIYKKENDTVSKNTVILELDHHLDDEKIIQLQNELTTQTKQIKVDVASAGEYKIKIENAKKELERSKNLLAKGAETQQVVDDETTNLKTFNSNLKRLNASVDVSKSRLQEAKSALVSARIERDQKVIKSPINGRILELTVLIGGIISMQESFAQISPEGKTIAICEIDELNAGKIKEGQKGWIRNVGFSDTLSTGTIYLAFSFLKKKSLFTDQSGEKEDRRVRTIKMMLDNPDKLLLNARVECVIDISNHLKK